MKSSHCKSLVAEEKKKSDQQLLKSRCARNQWVRPAHTGLPVHQQIPAGQRGVGDKALEPETETTGDSSADTAAPGEPGAGEGSATESSLSPATAASDGSTPDFQ
jgi:hypothetical protein